MPQDSVKLKASSISAALAEAGPFLQVLREKDVATAERFPKELTPGKAFLPSTMDTHALGQRGSCSDPPSPHSLLTEAPLSISNAAPPALDLIPIPVPPWGWLREQARGPEPVDLSSLLS